MSNFNHHSADLFWHHTLSQDCFAVPPAILSEIEALKRDTALQVRALWDEAEAQNKQPLLVLGENHGDPLSALFTTLYHNAWRNECLARGQEYHFLDEDVPDKANKRARFKERLLVNQIAIFTKRLTNALGAQTHAIDVYSKFPQTKRLGTIERDFEMARNIRQHNQAGICGVGLNHLRGIHYNSQLSFVENEYGKGLIFQRKLTDLYSMKLVNSTSSFESQIFKFGIKQGDTNDPTSTYNQRCNDFAFDTDEVCQPHHSYQLEKYLREQQHLPLGVIDAVLSPDAREAFYLHSEQLLFLAWNANQSIKNLYGMKLLYQAIVIKNKDLYQSSDAELSKDLEEHSKFLAHIVSAVQSNPRLLYDYLAGKNHLVEVLFNSAASLPYIAEYTKNLPTVYQHHLLKNPTASVPII